MKPLEFNLSLGLTELAADMKDKQSLGTMNLVSILVGFWETQNSEIGILSRLKWADITYRSILTC